MWYVSSNALLNAGQDAYKADTTRDGFTIEQAYRGSDRGVGPEYGLNPKASGPDWAAYQLPVGTTPTAVTVSSGDQGSVIVVLGH